MKASRQQGFTLIELMVTVVIIGILAAIAIPSYQRYVVKSNRASAQAFMLAVANKQEQYILDARQYATASTLADISTALNLSVPSDVSKNYTMQINNVGGNARTYLITATPAAGGPQVSDDALTLDNTGAKTPSDKW